MNKRQELDWRMLFGKTENKESSSLNSFDPQYLVKNIPDMNRFIQESLGKKLLKSIDFLDDLLKTPARNKHIQCQVKASLLQMKKLASSDMGLLAESHALIYSTSEGFYYDEVRCYAQESIVDTLEALIKNQPRLLKSIHFPILFKSKDLLRRNGIKLFENM